MTLDTQQVELIGRNLLTSALMSDGYEVALPLRDRGVDLLVYRDLDESGQFIARPIQLKASSKRAFGFDAKYTKFHDLLLAYVWNVQSGGDAIEIFCLNQSEVSRIGSAMGWDQTVSWARGSYSTSRPSAKLCAMLSEYRMGPGTWTTRFAEG